ncbi:MAG: C-terminal target protein [Bacteroidetes bacterium]|jgi:hypothetical protein|nr:C-terminal target protein [Bacteroidota bacterium]
MKKIFTLLFILLVIVLNAQTPYELFNSNSEFFFNQQNLSAPLVGLRPDSVKTSGTDSVYYHYRILGYSTSTNTCFSAKTVSWLGIKTRRKTNNDYVFYNADGDSLLVKSSASLNVPWLFYTYPNGDYIEANVNLKQYESTFDGMSDTVKTIVFQTYNSLNNPISNPFNSVTYKISKTQGIIKFGDIYKFPSTIATTSRCFGKRLTNGEIFDVNVGDTIISYSNGNNGQGGAGATYFKQYKTTIILTKTTPSVNTVVYTASVTTQGENAVVQTTTVSPGFTAVVTYPFSSGIQTITINNASVVPYSQMPGQFVNYGSGSNNWGHEMNFYFNPQTGNKNCDFIFETSQNCVQAAGNNDTCMSPGVSCNNNQRYNRYFKLGTYDFQIATPVNPLNYQNDPVYYSTSGFKCGSFPETHLGIKKNTIFSTVKIYPNPVKDQLNIENEGKLNVSEIKITDVTGKQIFSSGNVSVINTSFLEGGVYFLFIKTDKGEIVKKIIKE